MGLKTPLNGSVQVHVHIHCVVSYGYREVFKILRIVAAVAGNKLYTALLKLKFSEEFCIRFTS